MIDVYESAVDLVDPPCAMTPPDPMLAEAERFLCRPLSGGEVLRVKRWRTMDRYPDAWVKHAFRVARENDAHALGYVEGVLKRLKAEGGIPEAPRSAVNATQAMLAGKRSKDAEEAEISSKVNAYLRGVSDEEFAELAAAACARLPDEVPGARVVRRGYVRYLVARKLGLVREEAV